MGILATVTVAIFLLAGLAALTALKTVKQHQDRMLFPCGRAGSKRPGSQLVTLHQTTDRSGPSRGHNCADPVRSDEPHPANAPIDPATWRAAGACFNDGDNRWAEPGPAQVVTLVTSLDTDPDVPDSRWVSISARQEAILTNGHRVLLINNRGWCHSGSSASWHRPPPRTSWTPRCTRSDPSHPPTGTPTPTSKTNTGSTWPRSCETTAPQPTPTTYSTYPTTWYSAHNFRRAWANPLIHHESPRCARASEYSWERQQTAGLRSNPLESQHHEDF